jgi:hypothetical protein
MKSYGILGVCEGVSVFKNLEEAVLNGLFP